MGSLQTSMAGFRLQPDEQAPWVYELPETTLKDLSLWLKELFEMEYLRVVGRPDCKVKRVGILVGGGSLGLGREVMPMEVMERNNLNVLLIGSRRTIILRALLFRLQSLSWIAGWERIFASCIRKRLERPKRLRMR